MTAVIVTVYRESVLGESLAHVVVPPDVFAHAVREQHHADDVYVAVGRPAVADQLHAIRGLVGESLWKRHAAEMPPLTLIA
ncbi:hypothetical protein [Mycobacterium sp. M26]|uniref:hypothetical protein n=1 Tax=Mycobacterium sp. M26 TaxID=1762962 RepID=UPI001E32036C|nr:hypothetical protein [Mycobacterium sp. M26]